MDPPFGDGRQAVSYTNALPPGSEQQSPVVLSASGPYLEPVYTFSSAFAAAKRGQPETGPCYQGPVAHPSSSQSYHYQNQPQPQPQTQLCCDPMSGLHSLRQRPRSPRIFWGNRPDLTTLAGSWSGAYFPDGVNFPYNPSPVSTVSWPSPEQSYLRGLDLSFKLAQGKFEEQSTQTHTPVSIENTPPRDCEPDQASTTSFARDDGEAPTFKTEYPSPPSLYGDSAHRAAPATGISQRLMDSIHSTSMMERGSLDPVASRESSELSGKASSKESTEPKKGEPYAKLIEKALKSKPSHSMQLQEIYQWFIDNTDKPRAAAHSSTSGKGWQNSIRHNLSMNQAFVKKEEGRTGHAGSSSESRRSTEWKLEPWAAREGVQSTTRYRRTSHNSRRAEANRTAQQVYNNNLLRRHAPSFIPNDMGIRSVLPSQQNLSPYAYSEASPVGRGSNLAYEMAQRTSTPYYPGGPTTSDGWSTSQLRLAHETGYRGSSSPYEPSMTQGPLPASQLSLGHPPMMDASAVGLNLQQAPFPYHIADVQLPGQDSFPDPYQPSDTYYEGSEI